MKVTVYFFVVIIILPLILLYWQYKLCKKNSKHTLVLPIITLIMAALVGAYALVISAVMLYMHYQSKETIKKKQENVSEITKMNIEDL